MSHLRNLLYKSSDAPVQRPQAYSSAVPLPPAPITDSPAAATATATAVQEFEVEQAHLTPEARIVFHTDPRSPAADRFRLLRMRLKEFWNAGKLKKLLITGAMAGDAK